MMILKLTILMATCLFIQVKRGTCAVEKGLYGSGTATVRRQTSHTNGRGAARQIVNVDQPHANGWTGNCMGGGCSPIIISERAPVTINYYFKTRPMGDPYDGPGGNARPVVVAGRGGVTVNYDGGGGGGGDAIETVTKRTRPDDSAADSSCRGIRLLTETLAVLPSGATMPYRKFHAVSRYLPEPQKSDVRVVLDDGENVPYAQFRETLNRNGCGGALLREDVPGPRSDPNDQHVTLAGGTEVRPDDYRTIVSCIANGSETLTVPNVFTGNYSSCRSLLVHQLPELIPSAFVITPANVIVPFSLYRAVEQRHFNGPPPPHGTHDGVIVNGGGEPVDVQTVRAVIEALKAPAKIHYVFPDGTRLPLVPDDRKPESPDSYDCDPCRVVVDIGQRDHVPLPVFNGIFSAVNVADDVRAG